MSGDARTSAAAMEGPAGFSRGMSDWKKACSPRRLMTQSARRGGAVVPQEMSRQSQQPRVVLLQLLLLSLPWTTTSHAHRALARDVDRRRGRAATLRDGMPCCSRGTRPREGDLALELRLEARGGHALALGVNVRPRGRASGWTARGEPEHAAAESTRAATNRSATPAACPCLRR